MADEVAAFDVDGTMTVRDCVVPFMRTIAGDRSFAFRGLLSLWQTPGSLVRRDRDALKAHFARAVFEGRSVEEVSSEGARFAEYVAARWMRADVMKRFRWHQRSGHRVVLVSASLGPYLRPFGSLLGVDTVLCTELEAREGVLTGHLEGRNCRGDEKVARLSAWLLEHGMDRSSVGWAYGDSNGDRPLLEFARNGVFVRNLDVSEVPA